jgi:transcriptional regulator with XRE-family HTH domain
LRLEKDLSQEELADLAGLDRSYVSGIERGRRNLSVMNVAKIAHALDVAIPALFEQPAGPNRSH